MIAVRELADSGITVIEPGPRLVSSSAQELLKIVQSSLSGIAPAVIINMEKTTMVDSAGIGVLVQAMKHIRTVNGSFAIVEMRPELLRSFHLMNLHQVFDIHETEALARQQMKERKP